MAHAHHVLGWSIGLGLALASAAPVFSATEQLSYETQGVRNPLALFYSPFTAQPSFRIEIFSPQTDITAPPPAGPGIPLDPSAPRSGVSQATGNHTLVAAFESQLGGIDASSPSLPGIQFVPGASGQLDLGPGDMGGPSGLRSTIDVIYDPALLPCPNDGKICFYIYGALNFDVTTWDVEQDGPTDTRIAFNSFGGSSDVFLPVAPVVIPVPAAGGLLLAAVAALAVSRKRKHP